MVHLPPPPTTTTCNHIQVATWFIPSLHLQQYMSLLSSLVTRCPNPLGHILSNFLSDYTLPVHSFLIFIINLLLSGLFILEHKCALLCPLLNILLMIPFLPSSIFCILKLFCWKELSISKSPISPSSFIFRFQSASYTNPYNPRICKISRWLLFHIHFPLLLLWFC